MRRDQSLRAQQNLPLEALHVHLDHADRAVILAVQFVQGNDFDIDNLRCIRARGRRDE